MEQTLALIKPDAVSAHNVGNILREIERNGFSIVGMKMLRLTVSQASAFYAAHVGKPFYDPLVEFMTSGPCVALVLERDGAIAAWRALMGPTDSHKAPEGTLRRTYGTNGRLNATHGSDSPQSAASEIAFFFAKTELA